MTARSWIGRLFARPASRPIKAPARRLAVEALEDRLVPASFHVTSLLDDGSQGTLRAAILQANANPGPDAIDFQVSGTILLSGSELPAISDDLTITAPAAGLTVDAHGASRILEVNASVSVGLSGLTLVNGSADEGGGIFNNGTLSLTACTLSGNLARVGGGIYNNGGILGLDHVTLDSNTAQGAKGADSRYAYYATNEGSNWSGHAGSYSDPGSPGQGAQGGALYNGGGAVTISDSTLTDNSAPGGAGGEGGLGKNGPASGPSGGAGGAGGVAQGGGVCSIGGSLELINSSVSGNSAQGGAGGDGGGGGYFANRSGGVPALSGADGGDAGAGGSTQGGGVFASGATAVTLTNSTLSGNVAQAGGFGNGGGGYYGYGGLGNLSGRPGQGGGLCAQGCASVTLTNSTVLQNTAWGSHGANGGGGEEGGAAEYAGPGQGGGLYLVANGAVTLAQTTIALNTAEGGAGGIGGGAGQFTGGNGGYGGAAQGGGMFLAQGGSATIVSTTFSGDEARGGDAGQGGDGSGFAQTTGGPGGFGGAGQGGGAFVSGVSVGFLQATLASNVAQGGAAGYGGVGRMATGPGAGGSGLGGGLFSTATAAFTNCTLAYNATTPGNGLLSGGFAKYNPVSQGGNFYNGGSAALNNTLIAGSLSGGDVYSPGSLVGHSSLIQGPSNQPLVDGVDGNIVGHDPLLGPLAMHGGLTATVPLLPGSPAIDAGDPSLAVDAQGNPLPTDQRGAPFVRSYGAGVDIGAFEVQPPPPPLSLVVNTTADLLAGPPDVLSLREAIDQADGAPGSTITFDPAVFGTPQTIGLTLGELDITADMTVTGPGARLLTIDASNRSRIFEIDDQLPTAAVVTLSGLTLTGGNPHGGTGGAIDNAEDLTLIDSTVSGSTAAYGGGIFNFGNLNVIGSTISGNATANQGYFQTRLSTGGTLLTSNYGYGAGICSVNGTVTLTNSTISGNSAGGSTAGPGLGGGVFVGPRPFIDPDSSPTATLINCTITGNTFSGEAPFPVYGAGIFAIADLALNNTVIAGNTGGDLQNLGNTTGSNNWIGGDPGFDPAGLQNNGGPTDTIALLPDSPLIDAGDSSLAVDAQGNPLPTDQRGAGFARVYGAGVDIGAFEFQPLNQAPTVAGDQVARGIL